MRSSSDWEVVGVVEPDARLREKASRQSAYRGVRWLSEGELLDTPGLQAVAVETPVRDLLATAQRSIDAGLHIHLDKPAGASLPLFRRLMERAQQNRRIVQLGDMYRYNPGVRLIREIHSRGWLGEIFEVHAVMSKVVDLEARRALAEFEGGMMFELGGHLVDLVVGLLGAPERVTPYVRRVRATDDALADNMLAVLEYPAALATVKCTGVEVDGFARRHLAVCGTEGTVHIQPLDAPVARIAFSRERREPSESGRTFGARTQEVPLPRYERYVDDLAELAAAIRGEREFP